MFAKLTAYPAEKLLTDDDLMFFWADLDPAVLFEKLESRFGISISREEAERPPCTIRAVSLLVASKVGQSRWHGGDTTSSKSRNSSNTPRWRNGINSEATEGEFTRRIRRWGSDREKETFLVGLARGTRPGIAIGVSLCARALRWSLQRLWNLIRLVSGRRQPPDQSITT
jgi:hypothetical protein